MTRFIFLDNSSIISLAGFEWTAERVLHEDTKFLFVTTAEGKERCINLDRVKYFEEVKEEAF